MILIFNENNIPEFGSIQKSVYDENTYYLLNNDIQKLNTPTLILHGEKDVRCGEEQGDQLFNVIRALRPQVPCRLVVFPGENHGVTRTGLMHNRIRHMLEIRRWMEKYLMGREDQP